ncbi:MAG: hypothetical protein ABSC06_39955 [Rhodopila sp.]
MFRLPAGRAAAPAARPRWHVKDGSGRQITLTEAVQDRIGRQVVTIQTSEAGFAAQPALLETTLDYMNQGMVMVDAAGSSRCAICRQT